MSGDRSRCNIQIRHQNIVCRENILPYVTATLTKYDIAATYGDHKQWNMIEITPIPSLNNNVTTNIGSGNGLVPPDNKPLP